MSFLRKVVLTTAVFLLYAALFPAHLAVASWQAAVIGALVLGVLNALVRPVVKLLTLPLTILTLGLFLLVINALMLNMMTWFVGGFAFGGFGDTMILAIVISVVNMLFGDAKK